MARFEFHLTHAAGNNSVAARVREQTRMALICHGLRRLGHDAVIADCSSEFRDSRRWRFFARLEGRFSDAVQVVPTNALREGRRNGRTVAIKTYAGWSEDGWMLDCCDLAVFHEYDPQYADHPALLPVPFLIHTDVMDHLIDVGLFQAYMDDDLATIRERFACDKDIVAGFLGCGAYGRKAKAAGLPNWCQCLFYESPIMSPGDYLHWMSRCQVGFNMEGETPKSYRFSELTMLGVVNAAPECATRITPRLDASNSILMLDWSDADALTDGLNRVDEIVSAADRCYRDGWGPTGQARLIAERFQ